MSAVRSIPSVGLKRHHLSECWGDMSDDEWHALYEDIEANGQQDAVTLLDGDVLDGWHRAQVCNALQREVKVRDFPVDRNPIPFVISKNAFRRHLTASQRAAIVLKLAEESSSHPAVGNPSNVLHSDGTPNVSAVAAAAGVSRPTANDAAEAQRSGKLDEVLSGEKSASKVAKESREERSESRPKPDPKPKQPSALEKSEIRIADLEQKIVELNGVIDELTDQLQSEMDVDLSKAQQQVKFDQLREQIRVLKSQLNEKTIYANEWKNEAIALRKKVG